MDTILTTKQEQVLRVIRDFFLRFGYAPSLTELQELLQISTKRGVVGHLIALEKKGYIIRTSEPRGIQILENGEEEPVFEYLIGIPILGYANAGTPLVSSEEENLGILKLDPSLVGKKDNLFGLIIKGDSMNMKNIEGQKLEDGNYLIVQKDSEVMSGDTVVAIIDGGATVKNIKIEDDMIILYPESSNPIHKPIYLDKNSDSLINGKVIRALSNPNRATL